MKGTIASLVLSAALNPEPKIEPLPSVTMEGCASSRELALDQAFRRAVEFYSGSVVVNEAEVRNQQLVRTETLDYSAGRVDRFSVVSEYQLENRVCVTAEIWVEKNRIAHRVLGHNSTERQFIGEQHSGQNNSRRKENLKGDQLLAHVIRDYPARAYDITQGNYILMQDPGRRLVLRVPYTVRWNPNFLNAIEDVYQQTLTPLTRHTMGSEPVMAVAVSHPTDRWIGEKKTWLVADYHRAQVIDQGFKPTPAIKMSLTDRRGSKLHQGCWQFASADSRGFVTRDSKHVRLYGNFVEKNIIEETLPTHVVDQLPQITSVKLSVVDSAECR